jgi:CubicO group peptidase (beta-lactamase class C family)
MAVKAAQLKGFALLLTAPLLTASADDVSIDAAVRAAMSSTGARGLAIAVIDQGQVASVRAFGDRNASGQPLMIDTVMYGASLTKAVVGYLTAQLASEGALNLDRPIAALLRQPLPSYGNIGAYGSWGDLNGNDRWQSITPRMILTHSTGFANFAFLEPDRRLRIHFDPGTRYAYSGEGMMLLQFGIERGKGIDLGLKPNQRVEAERLS